MFPLCFPLAGYCWDKGKLIHDYFGIDYDIVWDIVTNEIPELRRFVRGILKK
jgi:uncharacterized protein with HEPN domain